MEAHVYSTDWVSQVQIYHDRYLVFLLDALQDHFEANITSRETTRFSHKNVPKHSLESSSKTCGKNEAGGFVTTLLKV